MLKLPGSVRIYMASEPVDLRRGFDGLAAATRHLLRQDPLSGHLFCFINGRRNRMKILVWEPSGFVLVYKRLERGRFRFPHAPQAGRRHIELDATELSLIMEGIDLRGARRRPRWVPAASEAAPRPA